MFFKVYGKRLNYQTLNKLLSGCMIPVKMNEIENQTKIIRNLYALSVSFACAW